jgi:hypothetical protein
MSGLPGAEILPRIKTGNPTAKKTSPAAQETHGVTSLDPESWTYSSSTIKRTLARPVDFATSQNKVESRPRDTLVDLSFHASPNHVAGFRPASAQDRQTEATLDRHRLD